MRSRLAAVGVMAALAALVAPTALAGPTIPLKGTSSSGYKNLKLATGTVIDASAYRIKTRDRYGFELDGGSDPDPQGRHGREHASALIRPI